MKWRLPLLAAASVLAVLLGISLAWQTANAQATATPVATAVATGSPTAAATVTTVLTPTATLTRTLAPTATETITATATTPTRTLSPMATATVTTTPGPTSTPGPTQPPGTATGRSVTVIGTGRVNATPNQAVMQIGVQTEADTAAAALAQNNEQTQAVITALTNAGVARTDIQTQTISLFARYDSSPNPPGGTPRIVGYTASNTLQVRVRNLTDLGELLDVAVGAGANAIDFVRFEVSNAVQQQDQARSAAIADARRKAEQLAQALGAQLGQVLAVNEGGTVNVPFARDGLGAGGQVPIEPGAQSIEITVQVTWELR